MRGKKPQDKTRQSEKGGRGRHAEEEEGEKWSSQTCKKTDESDFRF